MAHIPSQCSSLARVQHGLITAAQLTGAGITPYRRRRLLEADVLAAVHAGIYRFVAAAVTLEQRCLAACLAVPDAAISGSTAGQLLKLRRMGNGPVHLMVHTRTVELDDAIVHRTNQLGPLDVTTRSDEIRVLTPARLAFDLARFLDDAEFESVIEQMLDRRIVRIPDLYAASRRLRRTGRNGSARFDRVIARRPTWAKPMGSDYEVRLLRSLREQGIELTPQLRVELSNGAVIHLDGGDHGRRFGVEVDHHTWHGGRVAGDYDKWRTRQLLRLGWVVPRIPDSEIDADLPRVVSELAEIYWACRAA